MCRKRFRAPLALMAVLVAGGALAQGADLRQASCAQFLDMPSSERSQLGLWLHGFYAGAAQRTTLHRDRVNEGLASLEKACELNRAMPLIGMEARAALTGEQNPMEKPPAPSAQPAPPAAPSVAAPAPTPPSGASPGRPTPLR